MCAQRNETRKLVTQGDCLRCKVRYNIAHYRVAGVSVFDTSQDCFRIVPRNVACNDFWCGLAVKFKNRTCLKVRLRRFLSLLPCMHASVHSIIHVRACIHPFLPSFLACVAGGIVSAPPPQATRGCAARLSRLRRSLSRLRRLLVRAIPTIPPATQAIPSFLPSFLPSFHSSFFLHNTSCGSADEYRSHPFLSSSQPPNAIPTF